MHSDADTTAALVAVLLAAEADEPIAEDALAALGNDARRAYELQRALVEERLGGGDRIEGWKVGVTDEAARARMGLTEPVWAPLLARDRLARGDRLARSSLLAPRLEVEVALRLVRRASGLLEPDELREAVDAAAVAIEIPDSRVKGWPTRGVSLIADRGGAGRWLVGDEVALRGSSWTLAGRRAEARRDGRVVAQGSTEAVFGDPLRSFAWLVGVLARDGSELEPGQWVLTGTLTPMVPLEVGQWEVSVEGLGALALEVVP